MSNNLTLGDAMVLARVSANFSASIKADGSVDWPRVLCEGGDDLVRAVEIVSGVDNAKDETLALILERVANMLPGFLDYLAKTIAEQVTPHIGGLGSAVSKISEGIEEAG